MVSSINNSVIRGDEMTKRNIQEKYREKINEQKEEKKSIVEIVCLSILALFIIVILIVFDDVNFFDKTITIIRKIE